MGTKMSEARSGWRERTARVVIAAAVLGILAYMTLTALAFGEEARRAPLVVGVPATLMAVILVIRELRGTEGTGPAEESTVKPAVDNVPGAPRGEDQLSTLGAAVWIAVLSVMFFATGFLWTTLLFPPVFMRLYGKERWSVIVWTTVGVFALTYAFFILALDIQVYRGFLGLPGLDQLFT
jgi:hypothetical protein